MTSKHDQEHLLEEVAGESLPVGFRESVLEQTLYQVRRRRQFRRALSAAGALAAAFVLGLIFLVIRQKRLSPELVAPAYEVVQTKAFPAAAIISTKPLRVDQFATVVFTVVEIRTWKDNLGYRNITDDELLALVANRSGLLLRVGAKEQKLIFPKEDDQRGFPIN